MYKLLSLTGTKGRRFTSYLGFKQVHGDDGVEILCWRRFPFWKQLPVSCSPEKVWMAPGAHEVRGEDPALSSSHPGLRVNLSHKAQTIKDNGFLQALLSMLPAIWAITFIPKNVYGPSFPLCVMVEYFLYFS